MPQKKYLLVIGGPTASGKTGFAIRLARYFDTHILSCDSRQFFREMNIGTAKPTEEELAAAHHHFIGHLSISEEYSVGAYERDALTKLEDLFQKKDVLILVGGSGLYINALCQGLDEFPEVPTSIREEVEELYQQEGLAALQSAVQKADPEYFTEADQQNPHRLIRALAVCRASGQAFSYFRKKRSKKRSFTPIYIQMHWPRQLLYDRINQRVDMMIEQGLPEEVRQLLPHRKHTALQTVGYREIFDFFDGQNDLNTAIELIKRNTRRYAKRQLTWMRRDGFWKRFHPEEWEKAIRYAQVAIEKNWQWKEYKASLPSHLSDHFNLEEKGKGRIIALYQQEQPIAALSIHSYKRYEQMAQLFLKPNLPAETIQYFLHEAVCRCEEASVYAILPVPFSSFLEEWNFKQIQDGDIPEVIRSNMKKLKDHCLLLRGESMKKNQKDIQ